MDPDIHKQVCHLICEYANKVCDCKEKDRQRMFESVEFYGNAVMNIAGQKPKPKRRAKKA